MHVKSYVSEIMLHLGMVNACNFNDLQTVVCGPYMGDTRLLEECIETLVSIGLIKVDYGTEPETNVYSVTDAGKLAAEFNAGFRSV